MIAARFFEVAIPIVVRRVSTEPDPLPSATCVRPACRAGHVLCSCAVIRTNQL